MKVIVTGASGLLGRAVKAAFDKAGHEVTGTALTRAGAGLVKVDLLSDDQLTALIESVRPEVVVHCAAERRPDVAEANPEATLALNVHLPATLAKLATAHSFQLIFISTDYVFSGTPPASTGYEPSDAVGPTNAYGEGKVAGEKQVVTLGGTVLRVPVLYGPVTSNGESAVNCLVDVVREAAKGKEVKMDHWATRYPTNVIDVARVLVDLSVLSLKQKLPSIVQFSTQWPCTKYEMCQVLADLHEPKLDISSMVAVTDGPKPGETVRPKDCHLSNRELEKLGIATGGVEFANWWREWIAADRDRAA